MEEEKSKKKYWLKLDKNFLKSSQMKVIKSMPNGKDYIIFYLSLMLESVETVGHLRFTSLVPYNAEMLSAVTETNIDIVRNAIKIFCELGLMKIFDDGTIFIPEVPKITGKESESAERVRKFREKQKQEMLQCNTNVTNCNDNKEKDKEKDKEKEKYKKENEYFQNKELNKIFLEFLEVRKKKKAVNSERAIKMLINKLNKYDDDIKYKMIEQSIINSWKDVYELREQKETLEERVKRVSEQLRKEGKIK